VTALEDYAKVLVVAAIVTEMSVFMEATVLTLMALALGAIMIALGSLYAYRPGAMIGLMAVAIGAAASIELDSVLEVSTVLTALLGLFLPLFVLAIHALGIEQSSLRTMSSRLRPTAFALLFGAACVLSAPIVIGLMGFALPTVSMRVSVTAEIAVILLVAVAGSLALTWQRAARRTIEPAKEPGQGEQQEGV